MYATEFGCHPQIGVAEWDIGKDERPVSVSKKVIPVAEGDVEKLDGCIRYEGIYIGEVITFPKFVAVFDGALSRNHPGGTDETVYIDWEYALVFIKGAFHIKFLPDIGLDPGAPGIQPECLIAITAANREIREEVYEYIIIFLAEFEKMLFEKLSVEKRSFFGGIDII
ncbi:hypothetical protein [Chitinophaga rhizosphaerae]|uniref:hypothetical protein n=1 Tax=Chitinophaga rhizosphaerae TaxID=1864947 RepID=UPI0013E08727|nr:hypothetical protein [Chitinophaga rhizosphaerae]